MYFATERSIFSCRSCFTSINHLNLCSDNDEICKPHVSHIYVIPYPFFQPRYLRSWSKNFVRNSVIPRKDREKEIHGGVAARGGSHTGYPSSDRACRELNASTVAVEDVTARTVVVRTSHSHHKFSKSRTMTLKILLSLLIAATTCSVLSSSEDHPRVLLRSHRIVLPVWYHDRLPHARHDHLDDERIVRETTTTTTTTTTTKNPWTLRPQVSTTRSSQQINSASRHMEQWMLEQKFNGAVAMAENGGTRTIAYTGYHHGNHRHQPREMGTQGFQSISTTVPTYTRHHSGINRQLRSLWTSVRQEANDVRERKLHPPKKMSELGDSTYGDARKSRNAIFHIEFCRVSLIPEPAQATTSCNISPTHILISTVYSIGLRILRFNRSSALVYTEMTSNFFCCPGWSQVTHLSFGCNKPTCPAPCLNGGTCTSSGKCMCPKGYTGNQCQTDLDECVIEKPCGQLCTNLPGRYRCHCRVGFQLQEDGQSCRRNDTDENAFEARDLETDDVSATKDPTTFYDTENEVSDDDQDYEVILKRLIKLEKQVARNRKRDTEASEMNTKVTLAIESVNEMKRTVENVQLMQQEVYDMRSKMRQYEAEMRKIHHLMNRVAELESRLRIRCRYQ
ncbi:Epidermal growth factor-like protein 7 [Trachymyrmex zeteki]|uniref:Epidermal growth factor-like protein 7 n=1 Tax=Mycetomoellerius zeteki TaxID=64791 RepID=A0A151WTL6_9HYME|nr:Epidermal growth factor-like protein 7 [Trachymyrmex zeteki]